MFITRHRRRMIRDLGILTFIALLVVLLGTPAQAYEQQTMSANRHGQVEFVMPSGNIGCLYTPAGGTPFYGTSDGQAEIACDRIEPRYVRAVLGTSGPGTIQRNVGDVGCCGGQVFAYDHYIAVGPFQCLSTRQGLTCAREDGAGFFLSRAKVEAR